MAKVFIMVSSIWLLSGFDVLKKFDQHEGVQISGTDYSGPALLYDCRRQSFLCVVKSQWEECKKRRKEAIELGSKSLPCVPIEEFLDSSQCFRRQQTAVNQGIPQAACGN